MTPYEQQQEREAQWRSACEAAWREVGRAPKRGDGVMTSRFGVGTVIQSLPDGRVVVQRGSNNAETAKINDFEVMPLNAYWNYRRGESAGGQSA